MLKPLRRHLLPLFLTVLAAFAAPCAPAAPTQPGLAAGAVAPGVAVKAEPGRAVLVNNGAEAVRFQLYAVTGQLARDVVVSPGESVTVELPKGYYIVRTSVSWSVRVLVP